MKLLKLTTFYPSYIKNFYTCYPKLANKSYIEQKAALNYDAFGWADFWSEALTPLGYEVMEIVANAAPMQKAFAKEQGWDSRMDVVEIAIAQAKQFQPEIFWYEENDSELLKRICESVPSIRLVLGWTGSAISQTDAWKYIDLILSCAPESVDKLQQMGFKSEYLAHGFDPRINARLKRTEKPIDFSFIGQLILSSDFHNYRKRLLEDLAKSTNIQIYSPSIDLNWKAQIKLQAKKSIYEFNKAVKNIGVPNSLIESLPILRKYNDRLPPQLDLSQSNLKAHLRPSVFGLAMYKIVHDSKINLNIHADSSPIYASNMRLFEATGVGTCLVTDWRENLSDLFELDREVVTYKTAEECVEKVKWLLEHPFEREAIAKAGQVRTLNDHTFTQRSIQLDKIIRRELNLKF
jgi:spore maturation protein CgeB